MRKERNRRLAGVLAVLLLLCGLLAGCIPGSAGEGGQEAGENTAQHASFWADGGEATLRVLSGSENRELEPIIQECVRETGINIVMEYKGSVDIMRELEAGAETYDAVWPANSLWISLGDKSHLVKHVQSTSTTPVVFGIRQSLAEELGFTDREVSVGEILEAITTGKLSFCMTSATQSNSGASAYIGFLYALLDKQEGMTVEDLQQEELGRQIKELLGGIERSSGSSDWLKDMFLKGDYDAMVNYESLIISANQELEEQGREPLYVVYPYDGLSISDSPLGYVDHGEKGQEEAFLKVQEYLMSDDVQDQIQKTGRRTGYEGVSAENEDIFNKDWGIDTERILSPITMPAADVLEEALNLYQTQFRKPSLTVYCLDFSGSMYGEGQEQLMEGLAQVMLQDQARANLLEASEGEVNIAVIFSDQVLNVYDAGNPTDENMQQLYDKISRHECVGGTDIYLAAEEALSYLEQYDLSAYTPAVILMTDGESNGSHSMEDLKSAYQDGGYDVPIFSILFGEAYEEGLQEIADLTNGRVFDGREDLVGAFRSVKGYN